MVDCTGNKEEGEGDGTGSLERYVVCCVAFGSDKGMKVGNHPQGCI